MMTQATSGAVPPWAQFLGAIGPVIIGVASLIVSIMLAILYKKQKEVLEKDHEVVLDIVDAEWNGDRLEAKVVNNGNGVAQNISFVTLAHTDNGEHRKFSNRFNVMKRQDMNNVWANTIPADGKPVKLEGKSKVGMVAPSSYPADWVGISFSNFVKKMKKAGVNELKFLHLIKGVDLANNQSTCLVYPEMRVINPQKFTHKNDLENLGKVTHTSRDGTFNRYFSTSFWVRWKTHLYIKFHSLTSMIPFVNSSPQPLDTSGTRRVKRVFVRQRITLLKDRVIDLIESRFELAKSMLMKIKELM